MFGLLDAFKDLGRQVVGTLEHVTGSRSSTLEWGVQEPVDELEKIRREVDEAAVGYGTVGRAGDPAFGQADTGVE